jgi:acyl-[acyl-carrier-protein] desaturase
MLACPGGRPLVPGSPVPLLLPEESMTPPPRPESPELLAQIYRLFRDYFDRAEKKRRWSLRDDIPWDQCNRSLEPAIADVVESFCAVELYLPDYLSKLIPQVRANRGRAWMLANWGYEECKHSMALGDWLLRSGRRSDAQLAELEGQVFSHEWDLPYDNARAMVCYTTFQELATCLHYVNLRKVVEAGGGDPALVKVLQLLAIDERAHYDFFRRLVALYLEDDRPGTLEQLRRVVNTFKMPAVHLLADSRQRMEDVKSLRIFDEDIFVYEVYEPILARLGVRKAELRRQRARREYLPAAVPLAADPG